MVPRAFRSIFLKRPFDMAAEMQPLANDDALTASPRQTGAPISAGIDSL
jgi:hypothetical protein